MSNQNSCIICEKTEIETLYSKYPGYVKGTFYDIIKCYNCGAHFISTDSIDKSIYKVIYGRKNFSGYDRYYEYAKKLKSLENPLKYLAMNESIYYHVYNYINTLDSNAKILEVGCGYGYLTYSLQQLGYNVLGIDLAQPAINFAKKNFGDFYSCLEVSSLKNTDDNKFDLIISTEVIEHTLNPSEFVGKLFSLLGKNGKILLTTPNKEYFKTNSIWVSTKPPVHTMWLTRKSIEEMASKLDVAWNIQQNPFRYYPTYENQLVRYFRIREEPSFDHVVDEEGNQLAQKSVKSRRIFHYVKKQLFENPIIRNICNFVYNTFFPQDITLRIILWKKM